MNDGVLLQYFPIILRHFPDIRSSEVQLLTNGVAHEVFLVRDTIFKFPCNEKVAKKDRVEEQFFKEFAKNSPLAVPSVKVFFDPVSGNQYQTYPYIPGVPLTNERFTRLSIFTRNSIAETIGKFLALLHSYPVKQAEKMGIESFVNSEQYAEYFKNLSQIDKSVLYPLLTTEEWTWIETNCSEFYSFTRKNPFSLMVTHSDIVPKHILFDERTQTLSGIIDFSLQVSDPAHDFQYFDRYGNEFLKTIYKYYFPVDIYFETRRKFHARDLQVAFTYIAFTSDNQNLDIELSIRQLKAFIATHSLG